RPQFHRRNWPWLETLRSAGVAPEDIDVVLCTHLHVDHVGWNTRLENGCWVPTFPNARYLIAQREWTIGARLNQRHSRAPAITSPTVSCRSSRPGRWTSLATSICLRATSHLSQRPATHPA